MIYLDYAATTPIHPDVKEIMQQYLTIDGDFGNSTSRHAFGKRALDAIEMARQQVASALHAEADEIIWTSGATEANNLAIKGIAALYKNKGKHIITMTTEHKAVLDPCMQLEKEGFQVTYLPPLANGLLSLAALEQACRDDTILVSVMAVNNETGVIQDLAGIREITTKRGILLHTDAVQAIGKLQFDVSKIPFDAISLTAHKVYGPKGIGALFLRKRPRIRVAPLIQGGGQEAGMRAGTLPTHQIVGMGKAYELAKLHFANNHGHINLLRQTFLNDILSLPNTRLNVDGKHTVAHIANIQFGNHIADALLEAVPHLAASTAAACQEKGGGGSHVLRAMGLSQDAVKASIRFSFGHFLTIDDVKNATQQIKQLFSVT